MDYSELHSSNTSPLKRLYQLDEEGSARSSKSSDGSVRSSKSSECQGYKSSNSSTSSDDFFPENLLLPSSFNESLALKYAEVHRMKTAGQLRDNLRFDADVWLDKLYVFAMLVNPLPFCITTPNYGSRRHGLCYLVESSLYPSSLSCCIYSLSEEDSQAHCEEKKVGQIEVSNGIIIDIFETIGDPWSMRRYLLSSDPSYTLIQWKNMKKREPVASPVAPEIAKLADDISLISADLNDLLLYGGQEMCGSAFH